MTYFLKTSSLKQIVNLYHWLGRGEEWNDTNIRASLWTVAQTPDPTRIGIVKLTVNIHQALGAHHWFFRLSFEFPFSHKCQVHGKLLEFLSFIKMVYRVKNENWKGYYPNVAILVIFSEYALELGSFISQNVGIPMATLSPHLIIILYGEWVFYFYF